MRITVVGDPRKAPSILLDTTEATGLLIQTDDGQPSVIYQMLPNGKGWVRYTKHEDKNFNEVARQLGLI